MCFGLCVCFTDVHFSWHAQKPHVVKHFFGVCHFDALGSVSVAITSSVSVFCLSRLAHGGCWNTLWCKWPMVEAWAILGGISHEHEQDLVLFKRTLWRHVRLEDHRLPLATHMHSLTVHYFDNVQYDDIALNSVVVSVFELQFAHLWTDYAATQSGWIFFSSVESLLWYSSFQPRVPTCASWINKKKRKVTPHIKRSSNNLVQFALCAACLSQHDFTNAWVPHSHSLRLVPHENAATALSFPIFPNLQEVKSIGSSHNRSALPFSGFGSTVVTSHYNSPAGLYSSENIRDFNSAVDEVKTMTTAPEANTK